MLCFYVIFLVVLSASFVFMPFGVQMADESMTLTYISGTMFWIGFIGTIVTAVCITASRCRSKDFRKEYPDQKQLGLIHFFKNKPAIACDILMLVSLIGFIITSIWVEATIFPYIFLSILIFSFGMHCMLNGSNYIYINQVNKKESD